jgi:nucleoside-diphosphate-sugar epimerase
MAIMANGKCGHVYNVGSGRPVDMKTLLDQIMSHEGINLASVVLQEEIGGGSKKISRIYADINKLNSLF